MEAGAKKNAHLLLTVFKATLISLFVSPFHLDSYIHPQQLRWCPSLLLMGDLMTGGKMFSWSSWFALEGLVNFRANEPLKTQFYKFTQNTTVNEH